MNGMHPSIDQHADAIAQLCRDHHVERLDLFGSATTEDFDPERSDADFLVEFKRDDVGRQFRTYFALKFALEALLGRNVDLVEPVGVRNKYYWEGINATREPFFNAAA